MTEATAPEAIVILDGGLCRGEPLLSLFDRAVLYGDGLFETLRTFGGRPHRLEQHLQRLERGRRALGHPSPSPIDALREEVGLALERTYEQAHEQALERAHEQGRGGGPGEERVIRLFASAGLARPGLLGLAPRPTRAVISSPLLLPPARLYEEGAALLTLWGLVSPRSPLSPHKSTSYLVYASAFREAKARGADEALLLGPGGELTEGATSNLFLVRDGALLTPKASLGILPGVTRAVVLELAARAGIRAEEALLFPSDLERAEELFLTSSIRGLMPVTRCDGVEVGGGRPGSVFARLSALYEEDARARPEAPEMSPKSN